MKFEQYTNATPTISYNCETIKVKEGSAKGITFKIWDVGGQDNKRPLWNQYTRSSDGIIFVVDSEDKERLEEAKLELIRLLKAPDNQKLPLLVIANKQDLRHSLSLHEIETLLGLRDLHPGTDVVYNRGLCYNWGGTDRGNGRYSPVLRQVDYH
uniref:Uncharacterized protein n=1 Tax=Magallana gigas TaxID=29159 RepID=A0A8W8NLI4_MAGGI